MIELKTKISSTHNIYKINKQTKLFGTPLNIHNVKSILEVRFE